MSIPVEIEKLADALVDRGAGNPEAQPAAHDGITFTPVSAVLHRPADNADGPPAPGGCGYDCAPVT